MHDHQEPLGLDRRRFLGATAASLAAARAAPPAEATAKDIAAVDDIVRELAQSAALSMQFRGTTAEECRRWQAQFGEKLRALLGPHRPPRQWDVQLEQRVEHADHIREQRVLTAPGWAPVPFHLLLPRSGRPAEGSQDTRPAVLAIHGHGQFGHDSVAGLDHTPERKAEIEKYHYDYGRELVRRGYVVAAPCLLPFGRRLGRKRSAKGDDPCAVTFVRLQILGKLLLAENIRDVLWTLEYLLRHPQVDSTRIGCVGLSYGGRMTMMAAALEPRIKAAVISGALNCFQERVAVWYSAGCQVIPGLLQFGDVPEIGALVAPRPCVWEVGTKDPLMTPSWVDAAWQRIGRAYAALGASERLQMDRFEGAHQWHGTLGCKMLDRELTTRS